MKRSLSLLCAAALLLVLTAACSSQPAESTAQTAAPPAETAEAVTLRIGGMTGPTSMGLAQLMHENQQKTSKNSYEFTVVSTADQLAPLLSQGKLDMAALPANLAAVLYQNTKGEVQVLAVNTLGVLYLVQKGDVAITSLEDLRGKTLYATGQGAVPEYTLRYLLSQSGLDPDKDLSIEWKSEAGEVVQTLAKEGGVAMLPQPYVTAAAGQVEGLSVVLDLSEVWKSFQPDSSLVTGVMAIRRSFAAEHPQAVADFLKEYESSILFARENPAQVAPWMEEFGIVKAAVAEKAIPQCSLSFFSGAELPALLTPYLEVLYEQNPKAVGGALPDDGFYCTLPSNP